MRTTVEKIQACRCCGGDAQCVRKTLATRMNFDAKRPVEPGPGVAVQCNACGASGPFIGVEDNPTAEELHTAETVAVAGWNNSDL